MSKRRLIPSIILAICLLFSSILGVALMNTNKVSAAPKTEWNMTSSITKQGDNNVYYAWGTPDDYVLMEYNVWGDKFMWLGPYEMYTYVRSSSSWLLVHPGILWSSMVVWVADRTGSITFSTQYSRGVNVDGQEENGDGSQFFVVHKSGNTKTVLKDVMIKTTTEVAFSTSVNVKKGDRIIFGANSGPSNHQKNDVVYLRAPTITFTQTTGTDYVEGEDLSKFLDVGDAGEIAGYKDVSKKFAADQLAADETIENDRTDVIIRGQSSENFIGANGIITGVEAAMPIAIVAFAGLTVALIAMQLVSANGVSGAKSQTKKIILFVLCLVMAATCLVFFGGNKSSYTAGENLETTTELEASNTGDNYQKYLNKDFNNTADRANVQGYNGWYYVCGKPGALIDMGYNHNSGRWCSAYDQLYEHTYIWGDWYPDGQTGQGTGMKFAAPATGTMTVTIKLKLKCDTSPLVSGSSGKLNSNGVNLKTTSIDGRTTYTNLQYALNSSNSSKYNTEITLQQTGIKLVKGEEILFLLYANNGNILTYTSVDITVRYTGAYA